MRNRTISLALAFRPGRIGGRRGTAIRAQPGSSRTPRAALLQAGLSGLVLMVAAGAAAPAASQHAELASLTIDGQRFRDLDRDGKLDPYEDWRLAPERRAEDLIAHMTLEEKAGTMMHGTLPGAGGAGIGVSANGYDLERVRAMVEQQKITSFITRLSVEPRRFAEQNNAVQRIAAAGRLGIPVTISTDPRNHFQYVLGATSESKGFSQWPDPLGFGALRDPGVTRRFADIARQEYRAVGIHQALSPQADLATEPRWSRMTGTFGASAAIVSPQVRAYVEGFQGGSDGLAPNGVLAVVKHWVGYGAQPEGFDGHNHYGRFALVDEAMLAEHVAAFQGAFDAHVGAVMPAYPILKDLRIGGKLVEQVGPGFSKELLTGLLRKARRFEGIILSDWGITRDCAPGCREPKQPQGFADIAMPWGVETLSEAERFVKGVEAGLDQFGGVERPEILVDAVRTGKLSEARIDASVRRILIAKFRLGLFENPYVDPARAGAIAGKAEFRRAADAAQRRSQVVLENQGALPLAGGSKLYLHGLSAEVARARGFTVVDRPEHADVAIFRLVTPSEVLHPNHFFGSRQNEGRLDFREGDPDFEALKAVRASGTPVIASIYLDRPAILTNIRDKTAALLANFGASDEALFDVLTGKAIAKGTLPFELPASMAAVERQHPGRSDDSEAPLYPAGAAWAGSRTRAD